MSKLAQLLSYLEREDVKAIVFSSGEPAMLQAGARAHPLTVTPLSSSQIRKFFATTDAAACIPSADEPQETTSVRMLGKLYAVTTVHADGKLRVEVASPPDRPTKSTSIVSDGDAPRSPTTAKDYPDPREAAAAARRARRRSSSTRQATPVPQAVPERRRPSPPRGSPAAAPAPRRPSPLPSSSVAAPAPAPRRHSPPPGSSAVPEPAPRRPSPPASPAAAERAPTPAPRKRPSPAVPQPIRREPSSPIAARVASPADAASADPAQLERAAKLIAETLTSARKSAATDVHLMSESPIRVRRAGRLEAVGAPLSHDDVSCMIKPMLSLRHYEQLSTRGYTDLALDHEGGDRVRVNVCRQRSGLKACFRLVASEPPSVAELGLPDEVNKLTTHHQGLVVISGPNGHGKTTTMSALVDLFNAEKKLHIITVEDPVEIIHPIKTAIVTQREVGSHTASFTAALKAALREDPDIIAIGELRDRETVEMALAASETGHLVLATMSTPSGATTIQRLIDMFPPDDQPQVRSTLAGALKLVISQRLLRTRTGGLVAAYEMITGAIPLWSLIRDSKLYQLPSLMQRGRGQGMVRLDESLRELIGEGKVEEDEASRFAEDPNFLAFKPPQNPGAGGFRDFR